MSDGVAVGLIEDAHRMSCSIRLGSEQKVGNPMANKYGSVESETLLYTGRIFES